MEDNTGCGGHRQLEKERHRIGNRLPFPVIIRSQIDRGLALGSVFKLLLDLGLFGNELEARFKVGLESDGIQGLFQGPDVSHRGYDFIVGTEEALNLGTFGRTFYYHEFHSWHLYGSG
jgi:hypothetical protein